MNKFLLASTISMISLAAFAEPVQVQQIPADQVYTEGQAAPSVYQKQTVVRYNVPTCKNCQTTTTVSRVVKEPEAVENTAPCATNGCNGGCTSCGASSNTTTYVAAAPVYRQRPKSCVFDNHRYAIGNPLFVVREGQFSSETVASYKVTPKKIVPAGTFDPATGEPDFYLYPGVRGWEASERIMYGLTDWLSLRLQGGYSSTRNKKSTWEAGIDEDTGRSRKGTPVPHYYSYDGTIGLQAHAIDTCNFDVIVGVDGTWGKAGNKRGDVKNSTTYKTITPYAIVGGQITKYVTPYVQASYIFAIDTDKTIQDDAYMLQPGLYIQPSKYWAIHPSIIKVEHKKPEWNLALDFYPYQNLLVGIEGSAIGLGHHPLDEYRVSGRIKMTF